MNTFPRNSRHLGHMISALNRHYVCSEDGGNLIYACGSATETLTCINDARHTGLGENEEWTARERVPAGSWLDLSNLLAGDELLLRAVKAKQHRVNIALFGDNDD